MTPLTNKQISHIVTIGEKNMDSFPDPNLWDRKRMIRTPHETGITLSSKEGTATAMPEIADSTDVVGVRRPSENTKEHPKKHTARVNFDRKLLMSSLGFESPSE
ncbi:hypothetical protein OGATHE_000358 [Ogataea polymorpha]|uniref:Uncharacterized protein n=1 Tax=Ogataea polymorpha TaxID=460523 RepID=A0A9P8TGA8_9ASCO|nr:hypothetical protein OGATHE_000358 [Ogataea polymorpha]